MRIHHLRLVSAFCLLLVGGCGKESLKDKAKRVSNKAGQTVGESTTSFFTGVGEGIDKTVTAYDVRLSDELTSLGGERDHREKGERCRTGEGPVGA